MAKALFPNLSPLCPWTTPFPRSVRGVLLEIVHILHLVWVSRLCLEGNAPCKEITYNLARFQLGYVYCQLSCFLIQTNNTEPIHFLKSSLKLGALQKEIDGVTEVLSHKLVFLWVVFSTPDYAGSPKETNC